MTTFTIETHQRVELVDITERVRAAVRGSGIAEGLVVICTPHTTAAVTTNENADPDVVSDLIAALDRLVPFDDRYRHAEGNSAAHVKSTLVGASETVIVRNGSPMLGTWQGIYFCEFDGPRRRQVHVRVVGA